MNYKLTNQVHGTNMQISRHFTSMYLSFGLAVVVIASVKRNLRSISVLAESALKVNVTKVDHANCARFIFFLS